VCGVVKGANWFAVCAASVMSVPAAAVFEQWSLLDKAARATTLECHTPYDPRRAPLRGRACGDALIAVIPPDVNALNSDRPFSALQRRTTAPDRRQHAVRRMTFQTAGPGDHPC
jgi:hypothetical protein